MGRHTDARGREREIADLERALDARPEDRDARLRLVALLERTAQRSRAVAVADAGRDHHPEDPELRAAWEALVGGPLEDGVPAFERVDAAPGEVLAVAVDPGEGRVASGRAGGALRVVSLDRPEDPPVEIAAHRRSTSAVAFPAAPGLVVTGGGDGTARVWELASRTRVASLEGRASRCLAVAYRRGELLGGWRDTAFRRAGTGRTDEVPAPFPGLLVPALVAQERWRFFEGVYAILQDRGVVLTGERPLMDSAHASWRVYRPSEDASYVVGQDPRGETWGWVAAGRAEILDLAGRVLASCADARIHPPRGLGEDRAPSVALLPGGRGMLLGSAAWVSVGGPLDGCGSPGPLPGGAREGRGAWLWRPGRDPELAPMSVGHVVTAVGVSAGGGVAAFGTRSGEVFVARLEPDVRAAAEVRGGAEVAVAVARRGEDMRERGAAPERPDEVVVLQRFPVRGRRLTPRRVVLDRERLWLLPDPVKEPAGSRPDERAVYRGYGWIDLETGDGMESAYVVHEDGLPYRHDLERRWLILVREVATPAPEDAPCPGLPPPRPRRRAAGKKAVEEALGLATRGWVHAPVGPLVAARVVGRRRDLLLFDPGAPEEALELPLPSPVVDLDWSPGATRLALLLRSGEVWLLGTRPGRAG